MLDLNGQEPSDDLSLTYQSKSAVMREIDKLIRDAYSRGRHDERIGNPRSQMKLCDGPYCAQRRKHHDNPEPRGTPVALPEADTWPAFCSITCATEAGVFSLYEGYKPESEWKITRPECDHDYREISSSSEGGTYRCIKCGDQFGLCYDTI